MRQLRHCAAVCLIALTLVAIWSPAAGAHTGFESSDPADGFVSDVPIDVITLVFTGDAEPTGDGFQILEPSAEVRQPTDATTADGRTWVLRFEPAITGGVVGMRWMVKAPDAHPIDGSFSFTVPEAPAAPIVDETEPAADTAVTVVEAAEEPAAPDSDVAGAAIAPTTEVQNAALDEFLNVESDAGRSANRMGAVARFVTLAGTLIAVGGLVFAATAMRGGRRDVRHVLYWVRRAGLVVVAGAILEFAAQVVVENGGSWAALWSPSAISGVVGSAFGIATALRIGGGLALAAGARVDTVSAADVADPVAAMRELVGAGSAVGDGDLQPLSDQDSADRHDPESSDPLVRDGDYAWRTGADSAGAAVGALAVVGAHLFDGHTVTKGNRLLTGVTDMIHVAGGAIWAGGVLMLVSVLWRRHREGREMRARQLALRFSVVATVALVVVGLAGVILTIIVLDSPSELWSTEWGRILIAKTAFVGIAAAAGGYNHKILIPLMEAAPNEADLSRQFRNVVTGEAAALVAVVIATAFLMGAAS